MDVLNELIELWGKSLEGKASAAEGERLAQLLADPEAVERFTQWQAGQSTSEPESSLDKAEWSRVDARVKAGFRRAFKPLWKRPAFWFIAGGLSLAALGLYLALTPGEAVPEQAKMEEGPAFHVERGSTDERMELPRPDTRPRRASAEPTPPAPRPVPTSAPYRSGNKISVVVQRQVSGAVSVVVKDSRGMVLRHLYTGNLDKGQWSLDWDGHDDAGRFVTPGTYHIEVKSDQGIQDREVQVYGRTR